VTSVACTARRLLLLPNPVWVLTRPLRLAHLFLSPRNPQYVTAAQEAQSKLVVAAKAESAEEVVAAGAAIKAAAEGLLSAANPPLVWN